MKSICIYCGANPGANPFFSEVAAGLGTLIAQRGITLVYGGGAVGLMNIVAQGALDAGGKVIGVIPQALVDLEVGRADLSELIVTPDMHTRKSKMAELADGFIAMPGGFGTLDELFEILTWGQLGFHKKPVALLNVERFYDPLLAMVEHMQNAGFLRPAHRGLFVCEPTPERVLAAMQAWQPIVAAKWLPGATETS